MDMYEELNRMVEAEVNKKMFFNMKLNAYVKFQDAIEKLKSNDDESMTTMIRASEEMCRWWPEYMGLLISSLCVPIGETTSLDGMHTA